MTAIINFLKKCMNYLYAHPIHALILACVGLVMLILFITILCVSAKARKWKKAAKQATSAQPTAQAQPTAAVEEEAVAEPVAEVEETPVAVVEETPVAEVEETPVAVVEEQPVAEVEETPVAVVEEQPVAEVEETPVAVVEEQPVAEVEEPPVAVVEEQPVAEVEETPVAVVEETPVTVVEEKQPKAKKATTKKAKPATTPVVATETAATESKPEQTSAPQADEPTAQQPVKTTARYTGKWVICRLTTTDANGTDLDSAYYFELRASNGEKLLSSEEYTSENGAIGGIKTHKTNIEQGKFRIVLTKKGDYIFKLMNAKNTLLCTGANYATRERCERAVESVKRFAATAVLQEGVEQIRVKAPIETDEDVQEEFVDNGYVGKWIVYTKEETGYAPTFYFELYASNGEKLLTSEEYTTFEGAINGIDTHRTNIEKGNIRISLTKKGDYIFKVLSGNGQLLCLGEHYKTRSRCESAVESVKRFARTAQTFVEKNS